MMKIVLIVIALFCVEVNLALGYAWSMTETEFGGYLGTILPGVLTILAAACAHTAARCD